MSGLPINRLLAGAAALLGVAALFGGDPGTTPKADTMSIELQLDPDGTGRASAVQVAEWIRDRRSGLRLYDLRDSVSFEQFHLPTAKRRTHGELEVTGDGADQTVVVYDDGNGAAVHAWATLRGRGATQVWYLRDGVGEWLSEIMSPTISPNAQAAERAAFDRVAELSRYFGGLPRVTDEAADAAPTADVLRRARRRGCAF